MRHTVVRMRMPRDRRDSMNDYDHLTGADIASMIFAAVFLWTVWLLICAMKLVTLLVLAALTLTTSGCAESEQHKAQQQSYDLCMTFRTNLVGWDAGAGDARHQHDERRRRAERGRSSSSTTARRSSRSSARADAMSRHHRATRTHHPRPEGTRADRSAPAPAMHRVRPAGDEGRVLPRRPHRASQPGREDQHQQLWPSTRTLQPPIGREARRGRDQPTQHRSEGTPSMVSTNVNSGDSLFVGFDPGPGDSSRVRRSAVG